MALSGSLEYEHSLSGTLQEPTSLSGELSLPTVGNENSNTFYDYKFLEMLSQLNLVNNVTEYTDNDGNIFILPQNTIDLSQPQTPVSKAIYYISMNQSGSYVALYDENKNPIPQDKFEQVYEDFHTSGIVLRAYGTYAVYNPEKPIEVNMLGYHNYIGKNSSGLYILYDTEIGANTRHPYSQSGGTIKWATVDPEPENTPLVQNY